MYRNSNRIAPKPTDVPPNKRIRRLFGVLAQIALWSSGFVAGFFARNWNKGEALPLILGVGGMILWWICMESNLRYGYSKEWYNKFMTLQYYKKNCGICGAVPGQDCDAGLHS